jgi:glycosyltransferase involved in cell wall biosynthesis
VNICFVLLSGEWGGAETVIYELARQLTSKGESVSIVLNQEMYGHYADLEKVKLFNIGSLYPYPAKSAMSFLLKTRRGHNILTRALSLPHPYLCEIARQRHLRATRKRLVPFLSENHIDVISPILEDSVPLVAHLADDLRALNVTTIAMVAGEGNLRGTEPMHPLLRPIAGWKAREFRKALTKSDKVVGPSAYMLTAWEAEGVSLTDKYVVVPNGVNLSEIRGSRGSASKLKGRFNVLFPGGARFVKGGDLVVRAMPAVIAEAPDVHLYVAWNVPPDHEMRRMVKHLGLDDNVTFLGSLPKRELQSLLSSVDMLVMPSRDEAFGIVYLEAMALGKPIVASNKGGIPEVVKNGRNGILVELDPGQIAQAIISLVRDEGLRTKMTQNDLEDVARFDWSRIADDYLRVYREASIQCRPK